MVLRPVWSMADVGACQDMVAFVGSEAEAFTFVGAPGAIGNVIFVKTRCHEDTLLRLCGSPNSKCLGHASSHIISNHGKCVLST